MRSLTYVNIKYVHFCLYQWKWGTNFMFQKNPKKPLQIIVNIFVFFIKISYQSKESPLSKQSPFSPTPPFLEKIFHPHPYCQIRGSQYLLYKGGLNHDLNVLKVTFHFIQFYGKIINMMMQTKICIIFTPRHLTLSVGYSLLPQNFIFRSSWNLFCVDLEITISVFYIQWNFIFI